jgi:hypothetical protein
VTIEGGSQLPDSNGQVGVMRIPFAWEQRPRQEQIRPGPDGRIQRIPFSGRSKIRHYLTFTGSTGTIGAASVIPRPAYSVSVWTPEAQTLNLDTGSPGIFVVAARVAGEANAAGLAAFTRVLTTGATTTEVIFAIEL